MTWKPDPTTTTSTVPETTVPPTTVPATTVPTCDSNTACDSNGIPIPPTPAPPTTVPQGCDTNHPCDTNTPPVTTIVVGCPPGQFPQGPTGNEPCGPTDLCSGDGVTRNWSLLPCDPVPVTETTVAVAEPVPTLPATGGETGWIALTGTVMILAGISLVSMVKGRRA